MRAMQLCASECQSRSRYGELEESNSMRELKIRTSRVCVVHEGNIEVEELIREIDVHCAGNGSKQEI
jgi:hypothetical protein